MKTYQSSITLDNGKRIIAFSHDKTKAEVMVKCAAGALGFCWWPSDRFKPETKEAALEIPQGYSTYAVIDSGNSA